MRGNRKPKLSETRDRKPQLRGTWTPLTTLDYMCDTRDCHAVAAWRYDREGYTRLVCVDHYYVMRHHRLTGGN